MRWWQLETDNILQKLESTNDGLSEEFARRKLREVGANELEEKKRKTQVEIFFNQFKDFMIVVLLVAAVIAGVAGDLTDTIIIAVIVVLNAVVGFVQENKAEKAMEALKKISALQAHVRRDGKLITLPSSELVPGDIIELEAGNVVPADIRVLEAHSLKVNESALTGESVPAEKTQKSLMQEELALGDRANMAFKSTLITNGRAKGIVVATGMGTEIGAIAKMLQQQDETTPLQRRMADFGRKLSYLVILICILFFAVGYLMKEEPLNLLLTSISLAVAAIPEALPALITVALAAGAKRLVRKNALIRKLSAVETLGSVTFICSDKTGTLTLNKMKVVRSQSYRTGLINDLDALECCIALNHDIKRSHERKLIGDPTEIALIEYFIEKSSDNNLAQLQNQLPRIAELPFDSERKLMTTVHRLDNRFLITCKGAIESITNILADRRDANLMLAQADDMAKEGMRVLAYGYKIVSIMPDPFTIEAVETDLVFAGLVGMIDPPREEVKVAIAECKTAGITTVMITGDHPATASAIAKELGILSHGDMVVTGKELQSMSDDEFQKDVEKIRVYARVSPEQKLKIVKALQAKGHFVSMTGDGVNDAPSLKASDIGVAMGITGTDVSKESSDMILLDDNFATIVKAVKEGRHIYDNIRKFVKYIMTCNSAEILTMFLAPILGLPIPLLPIHILWINLVTDGLPGLALGSERAEEDIMRRRPRKSSESLFSDGIGVHIAWVGFLMAVVTLGTEAWAIQQEMPHWQTMVFTVLSISQLGHVMGIRSDRRSLFRLGLFSNKPLLGAVVLTLLLQLGVVYLPFANKIFRTQPLTLSELAICILISLVVLIGVEIEKGIKRS
ncbi:cation-translocating P-type ATPase [Chryseosolibacter indicus]|uniref:Cation-translocating P-type ATPase n=1 Tax=Chryseosolibacter indicus TaxID=2782351 RepID=A0ABS5VSJ7_9BACT|nr:cation-translocating P-type ATPase [Chryseosolibacter indicus]MBT1704413.1 cation-translocating P-type ATPase [Chryseosolibacter indicus]